MKLNTPKAVIFDWDNTLVDAWYVIYEATRRTFEDFGKKALTLEEVRLNVHKSLKDTFPEIFGNKWQEAAKSFYKYYYDIHLDHLKPLEQAEETLKCLFGDNIKLGIVSNKRGDVLREEVEHFGWTRYFVKIIGSLDTKEDKPSAIPALEMLKVMNVSAPQEVWFIGDTIVDMECANGAGCTPLFFGSANPAYQHIVLNHQGLLKLYRDTL